MTKRLLQILILGLVAWFAVSQASPVLAQGTQVFTADELAKYDGKEGRPAYYAFEGIVYDVSKSALWKLGLHFGHQAGKDLTDKMEGAPHGDDIVKAWPVVGTYQAGAAVTTPAVNTAETKSPGQAAPSIAPTAETTKAVPAEQGKKWYSGRIRILNISLLGWTGILLGIVFSLNFATCFALPWSKNPVPWAGSQPGPDQYDKLPTHRPWTNMHKPFAWATVVIGLVHGVLGFMQLLGIYL